MMALKIPAKRVVERAPDTKVEEAPQKKRTKARFKVRSKFDRAGCAVNGELIIDKELQMVTVREKGAKRSYSMSLGELCEFIARRGLMGTREL